VIFTRCSECLNVPRSPNYLVEYEDGDGDPYALCINCIDRDEDEWEAKEKASATYRG
jgi:hypothetical protein